MTIRTTLRAALPALGVATLAPALLVGGRAVADDVPPGDGPITAPAIVWDAEVGCVGGGCTVGVDDDAVYVLEHAPGPDATGRLVSFDPVTGDERWSTVTGPGDHLTVSHHALVVGDKTRVEVIDPASGTSRFDRSGRLVGVNDYGVVLVATAGDGIDASVVAFDAVTGGRRWRVDEGWRVETVCRDIVVLVPEPDGPDRSFRVVEHHTGRTRFSGEGTFVSGRDALECRGPWLYVTDGQTITEYDSVIGWLNWQTEVPDGAARVEIYREVALVASTDGSTVTAVKRETGDVVWTEEAVAIGDDASSLARLRRDGSTVFVLHPLTGQVVTRVELAPSPDAVVRLVAASPCRLVVAVDDTVTTFGVRDLTPTWSFGFDAVPDDVVVAAGTVVARLGDRLVGARSPAPDGSAPPVASPGCTF